MSLKTRIERLESDTRPSPETAENQYPYWLEFPLRGLDQAQPAYYALAAGIPSDWRVGGAHFCYFTDWLKEEGLGPIPHSFDSEADCWGFIEEMKALIYQVKAFFDEECQP